MGRRSGAIHYAYVIVSLGALNTLGAQGFLRFGYTMTLPSMREEMGLSFAQTGLLATANYCGYTLAALAVGWLVVRLGSRWTIGTGVALVGLAMIASGFCRSYELLLVLQLVAGACGLLATTPSMTLATAWFARHRRGLATGAISSGAPLGSLVTGLVIPAFILAYGISGWRFGWFALGGGTLVIGVANLLLLRNRPAEVGLDPLGGQDETTLAPVNRGSVQWGLVYRSPMVWYLALLGVASTLSTISFTTFYASYLTTERGIDAATAGQFWALTGVFGIAGGFLWGWVADRFSRRFALVVSFAVQAIAFGAFGLNAHPALYALCAVLYGATSRANFAVMATLCGDLLGPRLAAAAFGVNNLFAGVGLALGPTTAGFIADVTTSFVPSFVISAALAALGALGSLALRSETRPVANVRK
jgi:sugar phosphate permease